MEGSTRLFKFAAIAFFTLGLAAAPSMGAGEAIAVSFKVSAYLLAALVFWLWLYRDATARDISTSFTLLVGAGWLVAGFLVAPIYLLVTRGTHSRWVAVSFFFGMVLGLFAVFAMGAFMSVQLVNAVHL